MAPGSPQAAARQGCEALLAGELHNRRELARELGCDAATDAEVSLQAYLRWGSDALPRLRGTFALVFRDGRDGTALGARDPMGVHPLFYAEAGDDLLISPSIPMLLDRPGVSRELNRAALADHLNHRWPDPGETCFSAIRRIPPGHALRLSAAGVRVYRYWDPAPPNEPIGWITEEELDRFDEILDRAVERCLALGPAGIFLSGGLDSVTVAGVATDSCRRRGMPEPWALSLAFPDPDCNEEPVQRGVAAGLGMPHLLLDVEETVADQGLLLSSLELSSDWPSPLLGWWLPAYRQLTEEGARRGCKVVLTGGGGDEWLTVTPGVAADLLLSLRLVELWRLGGSLSRSFQISRLAVARNLIWRFGAAPLLRVAAGHVARRVAPGRLREQHHRRIAGWIPDWVAPDPALRREIEERGVAAWPEPPRWGEFYLREVRTGLDHPLTSLEMEQHFENGRRAGLRILQPFLDADLVDFLYRTPPKFLDWDGRSKGLVRQALGRRFPELGFERQKKVNATGYSRTLLLDQGGRARDALGGTPALNELGIVDGTAVDELLRRIVSTRDMQLSYRIWDTLSLEAWVRARL